MKKQKREFRTESAQKTGYDGEALVASLLPYSRHLNAIQDRWYPYDVVWKGINIDVKTTSMAYTKKDSDRRKYCFTQAKERDDKEILFVYVALVKDSEPLFWVRHYRAEGFMSYLYSDTAITSRELPQAIIDCFNKYSSTYKKTVDNQLSLL